MIKKYFYGKEKEETSVGLHQRHENIVSFWTKKEYELQELIINGFVVHRETPGQTLRTIPFARIDIFYDGPNGLGRKAMNGVEHKVYQEAKKFLSVYELSLLNDQWRKAKYEGKYKWNDPFCRHPIYDKTLPPWILGKPFKKSYTKELVDRVKNEADKAVKESKASLNKRINDFIKEINYKERKEKENQSPLQDLIRTKDIDPKEVVGEDNLSTLYKHIKGDRELSKTKAIDYAKTLGVAPSTLMFEPKTINVWSNIKFSGSVTDSKTESTIVHAGQCYQRGRIELAACPSDIYRLDIKAVRVNDAKSIYDGFIAYYYETNKISDQANNKLCMIRENVGGETLLSANYSYYIGIYQLYGTKKRILNPDPTSDIKVLAEDIEPDVVAPIVSFTDASAVLADKVLSKNLKQVQELGQLIRKEQEQRRERARVLPERTFSDMLKNDPEFAKKLTENNEKFEKAMYETKKQIQKLEDQIAAQNAKTKLFNIPGLLSSDDDDMIVPNFLKKEEKKRA